jgi:hypothetical protein
VVKIEDVGRIEASRRTDGHPPHGAALPNGNTGSAALRIQYPPPFGVTAAADVILELCGPGYPSLTASPNVYTAPVERRTRS